MKKTLTVLLLFNSFISRGQTSDEYFQRANKSMEQQNYNAAVKDFTQVIKKEKGNSNAYFNRAMCEIALNDFKPALTDLNRVIELKPDFARAYYSRATIIVQAKMYPEALPDLDKSVELDPALPGVLVLRGQIRAYVNDKKGACEDFHKAKEIGDKNADKYISMHCGNEQEAGESLRLDWPDEENWKVGSNQKNDKMTMIELIHANETFENWTEIGTMTAMPGVTNMSMDEAMSITFKQAKINAPKAKLSFIEKDDHATYPWIIFTIESPNFKNDKRPESQLYYIIQGKESLYSNFRAVKRSVISDDLKEKWIKFFKTGTIVNK